MRAMVLNRPRGGLLLTELNTPAPAPQEILIRVNACGVCRTDLHVIDGELTGGKLPIIPGHEIVGRVVTTGAAVTRYKAGDRVGVPWLASTCGACGYCVSGRENLCDQARFIGYQVDGGYAEYALADQRYCFAMPDGYTDAEAAPLLCAGLIGYRALKMAGAAKRLGIYGFGAADLCHGSARMGPHRPILVSAGADQCIQCGRIGKLGECLGRLLTGRVVDILECF